MAEKKSKQTEDEIVEGTAAEAEAVDEPTADAAGDAGAVEAVAEADTGAEEAVTETEDGAEAVETATEVEAAAEAGEPEEAAAEEVEAAAAAEEAVEDAAAEEPVQEADAEEATTEVGDEAASPTEEAAAAKRKKKRVPRALRPARTRPKRQPSTERKAIVRLPKPEGDRGRRQERQGTVVSDAMDKTIVVEVDVIKAHRKYKKVVRRSVKFHAHDEANEAKVGDVVRIVETRPLSATKRWRLAEIVEAAK